jgi:hypothetical protein
VPDVGYMTLCACVCTCLGLRGSWLVCAIWLYSFAMYAVMLTVHVHTCVYCVCFQYSPSVWGILVLELRETFLFQIH